jgi:hypothetical protein
LAGLPPLDWLRSCPLVLFVWIDGFLPRNNLDSLLLLRHLANYLL